MKGRKLVFIFPYIVFDGFELTNGGIVFYSGGVCFFTLFIELFVLFADNRIEKSRKRSALEMINIVLLIFFYKTESMDFTFKRFTLG